MIHCYLSRSWIIIGEYCGNLLDWLDSKVGRKSPGITKRGFVSSISAHKLGSLRESSTRGRLQYLWNKCIVLEGNKLLVGK
jgi:hypothetical protein